ncbi:MAG: hypothetical protein KGK10_03465 [Rhodospirillales bacterium]|nr:hypothetical protein [Rhodospirillales bacterium]
MQVGQASSIWASATTSLIAPTPQLENFEPGPTVRPLGGSSPFAALSAAAQSALLHAQEHQPRP